ncbi:MAG TPA: tRNA guanosine(34) transglycosylase Tgt [Candidatus Nanoarchaeia archaeon]|nr:tRNA guanosine(34) transglycosylase Tgt [Candidatus Nanoarchaeia archaeon]
MKRQVVFSLTHQDGNSRVGIFQTAHGKIETPFFMPAATKATGKCLTTDDYTVIGLPAVISNALILSLKPGVDTVKRSHGLHRFMNFKGIIFTDCGGFQMSRSIFEKKSKRALHFRNPYNQQAIVLTPQKIMEIEIALGSDVAMMLDDMSPYGASFEEAKEAMENTHRWAQESLQEHQRLKKLLGSKHYASKQLLFGIIQGNFYPELREESAKYISQLAFDGIAIGGVAIGEPMEKMYLAIDTALPFIPLDKPRYVMGVGSPVEILEMIGRGIDCFDSVYPAKMARHDHLFTKKGPLLLGQDTYAHDFSPIEKGCKCHACRNYTKAYLHHLSKINEPAGHRLKTIHNLHFIKQLLDAAKVAIKKKKFEEFKRSFGREYAVKKEI